MSFPPSIRGPITTSFLMLLAWLLIPVIPATAQTVQLWEASSGLLPSEAGLPWQLTDTASPEDPLLGSGVLTLATDPDAELLYFTQAGDAVSIPLDLVVETTLRLLSGSAAAAHRAPVSVSYTLAPYFGGSLQIGLDEIFLLADNNLKGDSAAVDTDDEFHTYRIEVDSSGEAVVFYDDVATLSGNSFVSTPANGPVPRLTWGMASSYSHGVAEWVSFEHNAGVPLVPPFFEDGFESGDVSAWSSSVGTTP